MKPQILGNPITLVIDSTGLKIRSGGFWRDHKYQSRKPRKSWRKLHITLNPNGGEILVSELTTEVAGDASTAPDLIADLDVPLDIVITDQAYYGQPVFTL